MDFALSTNWNSDRHADGEALVDEILALGFPGIELGYRLSGQQADGVRRRVAAGAVRVTSIHAPCPVPLAAPSGNPELFLLAARDEDERRMACIHVLRTLEMAVDFGATAIVAHAGRVAMPDISRRVIRQQRTGRLPTTWERFVHRRLMAMRQRRARACLEALETSLAEILPFFDQARVALCLENLPSWEGVPNEVEMIGLLQRFQTPSLRYWHDLGHGQVRQNLGFAGHRVWVERLLPHLGGVHVHDVLPPDHDHLAPGEGCLPFPDFACLGTPGIIRVFEPGASVAPEALVHGLAHVRAAWQCPSVAAPATAHGEVP